MSAEEHIESSARLGPLQSNQYETRFAIEACEALTGTIRPGTEASRPTSWYWLYIEPTNTPTDRPRNSARA